MPFLIFSQPLCADVVEQNAWAIVDVTKVENPELKGLSVDGFLTIARYDPLAGDLFVGARRWRSGRASLTGERAIALRSPVQKGKSTRQFLLELQPGDWVIESSGGTVFTRGSWSFHVNSGDVIDLGVFQPTITWPKGVKRGLFSGVTTDEITGESKRVSHPLHLEWHPRLQTDLSLPPAVTGKKVALATFKRVRFQNYLPPIMNIEGHTNCIDKPAPVLCDLDDTQQ